MSRSYRSPCKPGPSLSSSPNMFFWRQHCSVSRGRMGSLSLCVQRGEEQWPCRAPFTEVNVFPAQRYPVKRARVEAETQLALLTKLFAGCSPWKGHISKLDSSSRSLSLISTKMSLYALLWPMKIFFTLLFFSPYLCPHEIHPHTVLDDNTWHSKQVFSSKISFGNAGFTKGSFIIICILMVFNIQPALWTS